MKMILLLHVAALFGFVFQLGFLRGQRRPTPESRAYGIFVLNIGVWVTLDMMLYLPISRGLETHIVKAMGVCWIPVAFWMMYFTYRLVGRALDRLFRVIAGMVIVAVASYLLTDLGIQGTHRVGEVVVDERAGTFWLFMVPPFVTAFISIGLLLKERMRARTAQRRAVLSLLLTGGSLTTIMAGTVDGIIPSLGGFELLSRVGPVAPLLMVPFVTYAMVRHRFLIHDLDNVANEIFEDMSDGVVLVDTEDGVVAVNPSARRLLGVVTDPPPGLKASELISDWGRIRGGRGGDFVTFDQKGQRRQIRASCSHAFKGRRSLGWTVLMRDVTAQRSAEDLLRRTHEELEDEIEKRTKDLRQVQRVEAVGMMTGGIAHDFNNLLAAILGFAAAAREDLPHGHPIVKDLDEILAAVRKARDVVDQMLAFSRQKVTKRSYIDVTELIESTLSLLKASFPASISIHSHLPRERVMVMGDASQLHQAIMNLCTNAYKTMVESGGELTVSANVIRLSSEVGSTHRPVQANRTVCIEISDTGEGMSDEVSRRIFEPFFSTGEDGSDTGLGLAAAQHIVKEHQGTIQASSADGKGSTFSVFLPMIDADHVGNPENASPRLAGSEHILLVDDQKRVVRLIRRLLSSLGYRVTTFDDPQRAIEDFRKTPTLYDLLITDFEMPGINGAELAAMVKKERPDTPILLISGIAGQEDLVEAREAGVEWFLEKPVSRDELAVKLREIFDGEG